MKGCKSVFWKEGKWRACNEGTRKNISNEEENQNILFNFYLQVLLLLLTEMEIQLQKY